MVFVCVCEKWQLLDWWVCVKNGSYYIGVFIFAGSCILGSQSFSVQLKILFYFVYFSLTCLAEYEMACRKLGSLGTEMTRFLI